MARIPTASRWFCEIASLGSSHNRLTSAEDNQEALLLGYPPIGLVDQGSLRGCKASLISSAATPRLYGPRRVNTWNVGSLWLARAVRRCLCHCFGRPQEAHQLPALRFRQLGPRRHILYHKHVRQQP